MEANIQKDIEADRQRRIGEARAKEVRCREYVWQRFMASVSDLACSSERNSNDITMTRTELR